MLIITIIDPDIASRLMVSPAARLFQIYRFSDGKAFEPDFVLFLRKKRNKIFTVYQLFIEPKGDHLLKTDEWKEQFLMEIEKEYKLQILAETEEYKLIGLPFFNKKARKKQFTEALSKALSIQLT
jgi:type III restriction enzyme